jgi:hypothetical protein
MNVFGQVYEMKKKYDKYFFNNKQNITINITNKRKYKNVAALNIIITVHLNHRRFITEVLSQKFYHSSF